MSEFAYSYKLSFVLDSASETRDVKLSESF